MKNIHLICNAHLDPVWLWEWQEGAAEAVSTFRTAADLCEKYPNFIFNHNEVIIYKWVKEYEPQLFNRIRKLVKQGSWNIMGGWYLQPDCNMPAGESFVRQIIAGKQFFKKEFGVDVTTAINFDPFGHTRGLVQIIAKSGFDSYMFGRPDQQKDCPLPENGDAFIWVGYDGSEIIAMRFTGWYNSRLGKSREKIEQWLTENKDKRYCSILWGVGNHGGGPSDLDVRNINKLIKERHDVNIIHSTPQQYFKMLKKNKTQLEKYNGDLNLWGPGCYTSMIRIKQKHRQLENELYSTEKIAATAFANNLTSYPIDELKQAQEDLLYGEFHDILPGSAIQPVEEAALRTMDHGLEILSKLKTRLFFTLAAGQPKAKHGQIPILVYNPHPYKVRQLIECEFNIHDFNFSDTFTQIHLQRNNKQIPSQVEREVSNIAIDWRKHIVFTAELEAGQMARYDCTCQVIPKKPQPKLKQSNGKIIFKTKQLRVEINTKTGLIDSYKAEGKEYISKRAFEPVVIKDNLDSWGCNEKSYTQIAGRFELMSPRKSTAFSALEKGTLSPVRIIEDGPVRSIIEAMFIYKDSFLVQRYKLPKIGTEMEIETRVFWNEKTKMLKLNVPVIPHKDNNFLGQVAFGVADLPKQNREAVAQKWIAVTSKSANYAVTLINNGTYGCDFFNNTMRATLLRSPGYSTFMSDKNTSAEKRNCFVPVMDQGERIFKFWFNASPVKQRIESIDREALIKNETPVALSFFPSGKGKISKPLVNLQDNTIQVSAVKLAENSKDIILRLFEPTGKTRTAKFKMPIINKSFTVRLSPFEIKTLRINLKTKKAAEVNLLEKCGKKEFIQCQTQLKMNR